MAALAIGPKRSRTAPPRVVYNDAETIAHMMGVTVHTLGLADDQRIAAAEARLAATLGDVRMLDSPERVVRLTLVAFGVVPDGTAASDWLRARRQKRVRARRRRNI